MELSNTALKKSRSANYDNLKALLIFLVVFGHVIETFMIQIITQASGFSSPCVPIVLPRILYTIIYSVHMPAFIYITGKFSKFKKKKVIFFLVLYIVFQILYTPFMQRFYDNTIEWSIITPQWITWYLLTTVTYLFLSLFIPSSPSPLQKKIGISFSFLLSILVGFLPFIGVEFSLSRTLVFFPFFLMGKWEGKGEKEKEEKEDGKKKGKKKGKGKAFLFGFLGLVFSLIYALKFGSLVALFQKCSYAAAPSVWQGRVLILVAAVLWIKFLLGVIPDRRIPIITDIGKNTLGIFLLHGFVVKLYAYYFTIPSLFVCFLVAIVIVVALHFVQVVQKKLRKFLENDNI